MSNQPFPSEPVKEVELSRAPLLRVICQARFDPIASITRMEYIAQFQEELRGTYPTMRDERAVNITMGPEGVSQTVGDRQWQLLDQKGEWVVNLAPTFVSLETSAYTSRTDFLERLRTVLVALRGTTGPIQLSRIGVRYTDGVRGDEIIQKLPTFLTPVAQGPLAFQLLEGQQLTASASQAYFALPNETQILVRWGQVPANASFITDVPAAPEPSWYLDIDASRDDLELDDDLVIESAEQLCQHAYGVFRSMVTQEFLAFHGGETS